MTKGMARARRLPRNDVPVVRGRIPVSLTLSNFDGATGVAFDTGVIAGLPEGNILILGAVLNATLTESSANITDTFDGDFSVGSAPTADNSLSGAEVDIIPSTAMGAAVSSVNTVRGASTPTENGTILDNTAGTLELNLNVLIDDASISADNETLVVEGVLHLVYSILGDD